MEIHSAQTGPLKVKTFILPLAGRAVLLVDPAACEYSGDEKILSQVLDEHDCVPVVLWSLVLSSIPAFPYSPFYYVG